MASRCRTLLPFGSSRSEGSLRSVKAFLLPISRELFLFVSLILLTETNAEYNELDTVAQICLILD
jgi:hypothetical protein